MKSFAVANPNVNSMAQLRPPRPAQFQVNSTADLPGAPLPTAVASARLNSNDVMRPPRPARVVVNSINLLPGAI